MSLINSKHVYSIFSPSPSINCFCMWTTFYKHLHARAGFLVDKFGKYKPVVVMSLLLNAMFHHSLMLIPQQEIPGTVPNAYVMKHPVTGNVEVRLRIQKEIDERSSLFPIWSFRRQVWWSPCPSRECPDSEELDIVVDQCLDHCLLLEQNPKIEIIAPPTKAPLLGPKEDNGEIDDLNFHLSKRKHKDPSKVHHHNTTTTTTTSKFKPIFNQQKSKYYSPTSL